MLRIDQILDTLDTSQMYKFDRTDFLVYCNYMMFSSSKSIPPKVELQPYYRSLYKHIEMVYEEQFNVYLNSSL
jgi:hypothetical protein